VSLSELDETAFAVADLKNSSQVHRNYINRQLTMSANEPTRNIFTSALSVRDKGFFNKRAKKNNRDSMFYSPNNDNSRAAVD
jgi:hypothetical protein